MNKTLSLIALVLATAVTSFAEEAVISKKVVAPADDCRFRANEWQVDVAAEGAGGNYNGKTGAGGIGGDLGVNYFFTQYIGVGIDDAVGCFWPSHNQGGQGIDSLQADLLLRYPICAWNLAPYAMVGGGASWGGASQGNGNVGGGVEWRFARNVGFFAECRWLYGTGAANGNLSMALPRAGFRFNF